jgi:predicted transposase/invertase (TIGR01784 family)
MLTEQLGAKDRYLDLNRSICVVITDFPLVTESEKCHTTFQLRECSEHFPFSNLLQIDVLDLTKAGNEENKSLANWLRFIGAEREEEFEMAASTSPVIQEAYAYLRQLSADEEAKLLYEARLKAQRDEWSRVDEAIDNRNRDIVLNMASAGLDVATSAKFTKIQLKQVEAILQANPS